MNYAATIEKKTTNVNVKLTWVTTPLFIFEPHQFIQTLTKSNEYEEVFTFIYFFPIHVQHCLRTSNYHKQYVRHRG